VVVGDHEAIEGLHATFSSVAVRSPAHTSGADGSEQAPDRDAGAVPTDFAVRCTAKIVERFLGLGSVLHQKSNTERCGLGDTVNPQAR
jgi:hypothetical protein